MQLKQYNFAQGHVIFLNVFCCGLERANRLEWCFSSLFRSSFEPTKPSEARDAILFFVFGYGGNYGTTQWSGRHCILSGVAPVDALDASLYGVCVRPRIVTLHMSGSIDSRHNIVRYCDLMIAQTLLPRTADGRRYIFKFTGRRAFALLARRRRNSVHVRLDKTIE